jgi:hypothetical protein
MENDIKNIWLKFSCDKDWDEMTTCGDARYCDGCRKKVYDFTNSTRNEFEQILAKNKYRVCGRYTPEQMQGDKRKPTWYKWLSAAMVFVGIHAFADKAWAQGTPAQSADTIKSGQIKKPVHLIGDTVEFMASPYKTKNNIPAEYPGGQDAFIGFLKANMHLPDNIIFSDKTIYNKPAGDVGIELFIDQNGAVTDVKLLQGINKEINDEMLRVAKLTVWKPSLIYNKPAAATYPEYVFFMYKQAVNKAEKL